MSIHSTKHRTGRSQLWRNYLSPLCWPIRLQLFWSSMFRCASRPFTPFQSIRSARGARCFHEIVTDFVTRDAGGNLVTRKVPIVIGNPGEAYVMIEPAIGNALRAASPLTSASMASAEDRCKITFFHDSRHFGFGKLLVWENFDMIDAHCLFLLLGSSSYPRLYIPNQIPRQTESKTSPATLLLDGKSHEIVLDGTPDGTNYISFPSNTY